MGRVRLTKIGLALSIIGSLFIALSPAGTAAFLLIGRIIQGISAACIMPATLALVKADFDGKDRQRAISFWSIGSWGGSGLTPSSAALSPRPSDGDGFSGSQSALPYEFFLLAGTPESKADRSARKSFDWLGLLAFVTTMVALNIIIGQGATLGWVSSAVLILTAVFLASGLLFFKTEMGNANGFVDLRLFGNEIFSGATLSNFLLNAASGTLIVVLDSRSGIRRIIVPAIRTIDRRVSGRCACHNPHW